MPGEKFRFVGRAWACLAHGATSGVECKVDGGLMMHEGVAKERTKGYFCSTVGVGLKSSCRLAEGLQPVTVQARELAPACNVDLVRISWRQVQRKRGSKGELVMAFGEGKSLVCEKRTRVNRGMGFGGSFGWLLGTVWKDWR